MSSLAEQVLITESRFFPKQSSRNANNHFSVPESDVWISGIYGCLTQLSASLKDVHNDSVVKFCLLKRIQWLYQDLSAEGRYVTDGC
jgi:hypothetical protein